MKTERLRGTLTLLEEQSERYFAVTFPLFLTENIVIIV